MKHLFRSFPLLVAVLMGLFSCKNLEEVAAPADREGSFTVDFYLTPESIGGTTRSSYAPDNISLLTNVNFWMYCNGTLVPSFSFYLDDYKAGSKLPVMFPTANDSYSIYLFANVGQLTAPESESEIGTVSYTINNYASFETNGFPMYNYYHEYVPSVEKAKGTRVQLRPLVGRYDFSLASGDTNSEKITFTIKSAQMMNVAKVVRPFATLEGFEGYASKANSASEVIEKGDQLTADDIDRMVNDGETVSVYFLENCQGQLLPDNTSVTGKTAEAAAAAAGVEDIKKILTFIEFHVDAVTPTAHYDDITYRYYLGQDLTTDFSIKRHTKYEIQLDFVSNMITTVDWFIETEEPTVTGTLETTYQKVIINKMDDYLIPFTDETQETIKKGMELEVSFNSRTAPYTARIEEYSTLGQTKKRIRLSPSSSLQTKIEEANNVYPNQGRTRTCNRYFSDPYFKNKYSTTTYNLTIKSTDGLLSKTIPVQCGPVVLEFGPDPELANTNSKKYSSRETKRSTTTYNSSTLPSALTYSNEVFGYVKISNNPFNVNFKFSYKGDVEGGLTRYPNRAISPNEVLSTSKSFNVSGKLVYASQANDKWYKFDDVNTTGSVCKAVYDVYNTTADDSYNNVVLSSNKYKHHYYPISIVFDNTKVGSYYNSTVSDYVDYGYTFKIEPVCTDILYHNYSFVTKNFDNYILAIYTEYFPENAYSFDFTAFNCYPYINSPSGPGSNTSCLGVPFIHLQDNTTNKSVTVAGTSGSNTATQVTYSIAHGIDWNGFAPSVRTDMDCQAFYLYPMSASAVKPYMKTRGNLPYQNLASAGYLFYLAVQDYLDAIFVYDRW